MLITWQNFMQNDFNTFIHFSYFKSDPSAELILIKVLWFSCRIVKSFKEILISLNGNDVHIFYFHTLFSELNGNKRKVPSFPILHLQVCISRSIILPLSGSYSKSEITLHSCIALDHCKGYTIVSSKIFQAKFILFITSMMMIKIGHHTREKSQVLSQMLELFCCRL